jgi:beta-N-acetylhexosaminidase
VVNDIARQSLTLLYPSAEELRLRIPQPPRPDETILVVVDTRLARECYTDNCQPKELFLSRTAIEETMLRLYGPNATGQIQPEQISSITFSELKVALAGTIAPPTGSTGEAEENPLIQLSAEEVRQRIQAADWLIFAALDLNTSRYGDSDALKLFLAQESGTLLDKTTVVMAFNAPYYLDTTEITKLTAYYGVYSKTTPHVEAAVRALFGEADWSGASPVSVEGIGYQLVDVLASDPVQTLLIEPIGILPENRTPPVSVKVRVGPVVDRNGHIVPDGTPIEIRAMLGERQVAAEIVSTEAGLAEATITLTEPGEIEVFALAEPNVTSESILVSVVTPPADTPTPEVTVVSPPTPTETPTLAPSATPTTLPTTTPLAPLPPDNVSSPPIEPSTELRQMDGIDLLSALSATLLAGLVGFWLGQQSRKSLSRKVRFGLWVLIGGLAAYLLYAAGWLRPEEWLLEKPDLLTGRFSVAGVAFVFSLAAIGMNRVNSRQ